MATQNHVHIPDDLLSEAASADGKTTDELAADALRRCLADRKLGEPGEPEVPAWLKPTVQSLLDLLRLPQNWDGYGAVQIQEQIAQKALMVLVEVMENEAPAPSVVPLSDGGIQVEWHRRARNLEIEFPALEAPGFYYYEDGSELESEGQVSGNYNRIQAYVASLK